MEVILWTLLFFDHELSRVGPKSYFVVVVVVLVVVEILPIYFFCLISSCFAKNFVLRCIKVYLSVLRCTEMCLGVLRCAYMY